MSTPPQPSRDTTTRHRGPDWQPGLLSLPLPEGLALCLSCPWGEHDGAPDAPPHHTHQTHHPTIYHPNHTPEPRTTEAPNQ